MEAIEIFQHTKIGATVVHVVSVVLGMGSALVSDLLFTFFSKDKKLNKTELKTLEILAQAVLYSLVAIIVSGGFIFLSDIEKYSTSAKFLSKMTIVGILLLNGILLNKFAWSHLLDKNFFTSKKASLARKLAFAFGAVSVISWISACVLGILDSLDMSYAGIMSIYLGITAFSVVVSLLVEKKEFN